MDPTKKPIFVPQPKPVEKPQPDKSTLGSTHRTISKSASYSNHYDKYSLKDREKGLERDREKDEEEKRKKESEINDDEVTEGFWYPVDRFLWDAPLYFRVNISLKTFYPGNEHLFKSILGISGANSSHFVAEACSFAIDDPPRYMLKILKAMNENMRCYSYNWYGFDEELKSIKMWPVSLQGCESEIKLSSTKEEWFIADRYHWATTFRKVVPILVFDFDDQKGLEYIFSRLDLTPRYISKASKTIQSAKGRVVPSPQYTESFRSKHNFFVR